MVQPVGMDYEENIQRCIEVLLTLRKHLNHRDGYSCERIRFAHNTCNDGSVPLNGASSAKYSPRKLLGKADVTTDHPQRRGGFSIGWRGRKLSQSFTDERGIRSERTDDAGER